eukprot:4861253-Amphidinium_carterae.1
MLTILHDDENRRSRRRIVNTYKTDNAVYIGSRSNPKPRSKIHGSSYKEGSTHSRSKVHSVLAAARVAERPWYLCRLEQKDSHRAVHHSSESGTMMAPPSERNRTP